MTEPRPLAELPPELGAALASWVVRSVQRRAAAAGLTLTGAQAVEVAKAWPDLTIGELYDNRARVVKEDDT